MDLKPFNINDCVYVKLTEAGKKELRKQHDELNKVCGVSHKYVFPKIDAKGWTEFQLWSLMKRFGHMMYNGAVDMPFETTIKFEAGE